MAAISKTRKAVADGVFYAELNELLMRELGGEGYSGVEVRVTPMRTEVIIRATRTQNVLGVKGRRIRELTSVVQKRFKFPEGSVELYAEKVRLLTARELGCQLEPVLFCLSMLATAWSWGGVTPPSMSVDALPCLSPPHPHGCTVVVRLLPFLSMPW
jgi:hypothetical protein